MNNKYRLMLVVSALAGGLGLSVPAMSQTAELQPVLWNGSGGSLSCREQVFQVPFDAAFNTDPNSEPMPEWFSDGPGGFALPEYSLTLNDDGTYHVGTSFSLSDFREETGVWRVQDGALSFACPQGGCTTTESSETIDTPAAVPVFETTAEFAQGTAAFYYADTRRLLCRTEDALWGTAQHQTDDGANEDSTNEDSTSDDGTHMTAAEGCDYTSAGQNGGWGWDAAAGASCPPSNGCDYSDADQNGGWGWDPVAELSCPPTQGCDYTDAGLNGGWGWDASAAVSCPPRDGCDYSAAETNSGWGWNASTATSCPPVSG